VSVPMTLSEGRTGRVKLCRRIM